MNVLQASVKADLYMFGSSSTLVICWFIDGVKIWPFVCMHVLCWVLTLAHTYTYIANVYFGAVREKNPLIILRCSKMLKIVMSYTLQ